MFPIRRPLTVIALSLTLLTPARLPHARPPPPPPPPPLDLELPVLELPTYRVDAELAVTLASTRRAALRADELDVASAGSGELQAQLQTTPGTVWVAGPPRDPAGWALLEPRCEGDVEVGLAHFWVRSDHPAAGLARELLVTHLIDGARELRLASVTASTYAGSDTDQFLLSDGWAPDEAPPFGVRRLELTGTVDRRRRLVDDAYKFASGYQIARAEQSEGESLPDGVARLRVVAKVPIVGPEVGHSEVTIHSDAPEAAISESTFVDEAHRGHRLGLLMIAEILRWIEAEYPRVRAVQSRTNLDDTYTIALHDRLGARGAGVQHGLRRSL